jgi:HEAT repeat protein
MGRGDAEYDAGTRALDQHHYEEAILHFDQVINSKSARADGALYWKAYALNRSGKRDDALAALAQLRRDYASSAWLNDAQALETEVKQSSGQPVSPSQESDDDLKLLAINSLMNADAERAVPLIEGILKGNSPPKVKRDALFVLTQSRSPRAQQLLNDYAKGGGNPDLQLQAIRYLGQSGSRDTQQQLGGIYGTTNDARVKTTIIDSLSGTRAWDALLNIAKTEKDANLRNQAIRAIASNRSAPIDGLLEMYPNLDMSAKSAIVDGLVSRRDAKTLVDLAHKETDPQMKRRIVERVGNMHDNKDAMDYMMEILKQ